MADPHVALKLDRSLLDPNFDGYKLSLDPLPRYEVPLETDVDNIKLSDNQYSYQHVKAFGIHNQLHLDPWNQQLAFWIDQQWRVMKVHAAEDNRITSPSVSFQIPDSKNLKLIPDRLHITAKFLAADWLVLSDGTGQLYLIQTKDRKEDEEWKLCYQGAMLEDNKPFTILDAQINDGHDKRQIHILLLYVAKDDAATEVERGSAFVTMLEWVTLAAVDGDKWEIVRRRRLKGSACPDYATYDADGTAVFMASEKPFTFTHDSLKPVEVKTVKNESTEPDDVPPAYTWSQTSEDLDVQFTIAKSVSRQDVLFRLTSGTLDLGVKNGESLLAGTLGGAVDVEASTWTLDTEHQRLELHLEKSREEMWETVVEEDTRGKMTIDPDMVAEIHDRLARLTSDQCNPNPECGDEKAYNAQQLEECDAFPGDTAALVRLDGESHEITHQMNLASHQWLFNTQSEPGRPPCVCLRHDVDGVAWQPSTEERSPGRCPLHHTATFNAFGYVQASKQQRKFSTCAPDFSYAVVCDCVRHVYIYRQPSAILSPLRNRKTGRQVDAVAKQQLISLESVQDIVGLAASKDRVFILAGQTLHVVRVNN